MHDNLPALRRASGTPEQSGRAPAVETDRRRFSDSSDCPRDRCSCPAWSTVGLAQVQEGLVTAAVADWVVVVAAVEVLQRHILLQLS